MLLVDDCELDRLDTVGDGKHLRFRVRQRGRDAGSAIAFGFGAQIDRYRRPTRYDVAFRLTENRWNGTVAPQLVVRRIFDTDERYEELHAWFGEQWRRGEDAWTPEVRAVFDELGLAVRGSPAEPARVGAFPATAARGAAARGGGLKSLVRLRGRSTSSKRAARRSLRSVAAAADHHGSARFPAPQALSCRPMSGEGSALYPG